MLSAQAQKIMNEYFNLPFKGVEGVRCPYFNNSRLKQRAQLRVLVGKGTPKEIVEEAKIISIQYHAGIFDTSGHCCLHETHHHSYPSIADDVRKFLVDHNLGVECSGFVTQILRAHFQEIRGVDIAHCFYIISPRYFFRWLISKIRPVENISVRSYANNKNTKKVDWRQAQTGDVLIMLETGPQKKRNHVLLIINNNNGVIEYTHARQWVADGKYGHGVAKGKIKIIKPNDSLLEQEWVELDKRDTHNETFMEAKNAAVLEVRRVICF